MKLRTLAWLALLFCPLISARAQHVIAGPFYGYRVGGEFANDLTGDTYRIQDNPSYGVYLDIDPKESGLRLELLYSYQDTRVKVGNLVTPDNGKLRVHDFMVGGLQELYDGRIRPYVAGYLGATWFEMPEVGDDLRFSFTVAAGVNYYLGKNLGLRLDVRGFGTVVKDNSGFACANGGCAIGYSGDVLWQGEATASVFVAF